MKRLPQKIFHCSRSADFRKHALNYVPNVILRMRRFLNEAVYLWKRVISRKKTSSAIARMAGIFKFLRVNFLQCMSESLTSIRFQAVSGSLPSPSTGFWDPWSLLALNPVRHCEGTSVGAVTATNTCCFQITVVGSHLVTKFLQKSNLIRSLASVLFLHHLYY